MTRKTQILLVFAAVSCALLTASGALAQSRSSAEISLLRAVNATRTAHGLRPVSLDARLTHAARAHSVEMLRGGYFAHGNLHGRMVAFHVRGPFVGENLAWGNGSYASPATVISEWLRSPEHRANLLRPGFARIGIGVVTTSGQGTFLGTGGATVMTADFAGH
jgi:uncharacterized protein YkwD